jgi:hypothetical protein
MWDTSVPRTVRREQVKRKTFGNPVEIPYIPVTEESMERGTISIKLPNNTRINVTEIHCTANKENFLMTMIAGNRSLHDLGFYLKAMKYQKIIKKCVAILKDNYQPEPVQGAQVDHIKKQVYDTAKARHDNVVKQRNKTVEKMLSTLKSFMHESICPILEDIMLKKLGVSPWINLQGKEMNKPCEYTLAGYKICWMFFMRTVFQHDAAEQLLMYNLKKPKELAARVFAGRIMQMNNYIEHLPCLFYSERATNTIQL